MKGLFKMKDLIPICFSEGVNPRTGEYQFFEFNPLPVRRLCFKYGVYNEIFALVKWGTIVTARYSFRDRDYVKKYVINQAGLLHPRLGFTTLRPDHDIFNPLYDETEKWVVKCEIMI